LARSLGPVGSFGFFPILQQVVFQFGYILDVVEALGPFPLCFGYTVWQRGSIGVINFRRRIREVGVEIIILGFYVRSVDIARLP
jgi:hypothetical protein